MCFATEDGNRCYVGFAPDRIGPYIQPDCNAYGGAEGMSHVANIAAFCLLLRDTLSGSVCLTNKGYCGKLWVHDGYIDLT